MSLTGKIVVVTGANSGTGFEATKSLAAKGAEVVMGCRSDERGEAAAQRIREKLPGARLEVMHLDLAALSSVRAFAEKLKRKYPSLQLLCNNAGVMQTPRLRTEDGFELQFGTNHLGHFALTGLLLDLLSQAAGSRVITVSSMMHQRGRIDFDDLNAEKSYSRSRAYAQSKLANLLFAYELQRRLERSGLDILSVAAHPGYAATNLQFAGPGLDGGARGLRWMYQLSNKLLAQSAEMGALPILYAATAPDVHGGDYIGPRGLFGMRGIPKKVQSSRRSYDEEAAKRLWEISEELTGVRYAFCGPEKTRAS